jgi:uncharacterized phage protein (TIGR01671 family)
MREYKFRDYDPEKKEIRYFDLDHYDREEHNSWGNITEFTGLQDKNGVEIYEGDIVGDKKSWSIVIWCDKCIGWQYAWYDFDLGEKICHMCHGDFDITETFENGISYDDEKVIGNIYENPELLDKD